MSSPALSTTSGRSSYVADDLYHELRCLLGAATVWRALRAEQAGFSVIVAMDSAFVHARNLYNFFTLPEGGHDVSVTAFGPASPYSSATCDAWMEPLNRHVLHMSRGRLNPTNVQSGGHLTKQIETFAHDILRLWRLFEADPAAADIAVNLTDTNAS